MPEKIAVENVENAFIKIPLENRDAVAAAYALNMCTVSVSQIVDYNDPIILEHEYDAILNNLNLEKMPKKDSALLDILEKILDVITFFRIDEQERKLVENDYKFRMKNAIWNAVPNFALISSGGNLVSLVISLASQVGIGYMNYRRAKSENTREYEREIWSLERSAIEQLNALRRQLFDTAWHLSDTYGFQDELRLTERQIAQYNAALTDPDPVRKYERLDVMKQQFAAYPPFWYHFGHTANMIAQKHCPGSANENEAVFSEYKNRACLLFDQYHACNVYDLLRDDPITSACCLEHIDLLDASTDANKIQKLLSCAVRYSGGAEDVLQLCVFAYLRINDHVSAQKILRQLFNSDYNAELNGTLLSQLYVSDWYKATDRIGKESIRADYDLLASRAVDVCTLFPFPQNNLVKLENLEYGFAEIRKYILREKYFYGLKAYFEKCATEFNKQIPIWIDDRSRNSVGYDAESISDYNYGCSEEAITYRYSQAKKAFEREETAACYRIIIEQSQFWNGYLDLFEKMVQDISKLSFIDNPEELAESLRSSIRAHKSVLNKCINALGNGESSFGLRNYRELQELSFFAFSERFIKLVYKYTENYIKSLECSKFDQHATIWDAESDIREFCLNNELGEPEQYYTLEETLTKEANRRFFSDELLGDDYDELKKHKEFIASLVKEVSAVRSDLLVEESKKTVVLVRGEPGFAKYLSRKPLLKKKAPDQGKVIAVIDDQSGADIDLIFTTTGITPIVKGHIKPEVQYQQLAAYVNNNGNLKIKGVNQKSVKQGLRDAAILTLTPLVFALGYGINMAVDAIQGDSLKRINIDALLSLSQRLARLTATTQDISVSDQMTKLFSGIYTNLITAEKVNLDRIENLIGGSPDLYNAVAIITIDKSSINESSKYLLSKFLHDEVNISLEKIRTTLNTSIVRFEIAGANEKKVCTELDSLAIRYVVEHRLEQRVIENDVSCEDILAQKLSTKGIAVYKQTPRTDCRKCGCQSCMEFGEKVSSGKMTVDNCPYYTLSAEEEAQKRNIIPDDLIEIILDPDELLLDCSVQNEPPHYNADVLPTQRTFQLFSWKSENHVKIAYLISKYAGYSHPEALKLLKNRPACFSVPIDKVQKLADEFDALSVRWIMPTDLSH